MSHGLKGKAAIITGSTSGIGLGLAQSLAAEGADIMLNGFGDPAEIERMRKGLAATNGVHVGYNNADLSKAAAVHAIIDQAVGELGSVVGLTKVVALETAATGITCKAVCPGWVLTPAASLAGQSMWMAA